MSEVIPGATLQRSRVSSEQLDMLLSFMEEHPEFAAGKQSVYSRFSSSKLWRLLAERLNGAAAGSGGARKSPDKWCRYWADIKYKARKKCASGGGELSHMEERVQAVLAAGGDEDRKPLTSDEPEEGPTDCEGVGTEELLAEAAMRSALAAEKQAEAVVQGVELLRELVSLWRSSNVIHPEHSLHQHHRL